MTRREGKGTMSGMLQRLSVVCVIAALVFAPFAFGAVQPWAYGILAALAYTAAAAALVSVVLSGAEHRLRMGILIPLLLGVGLVFLQYVQWPLGLLEHISPSTVGFCRIDAEATGASLPSWLAPSLCRHATHEALICLSAYVALFIAVNLYIRVEKQISRLALAIICTGFGVSLLGVLQRLSGTDKLYWVRQPKYGGAIFGPFVSRNQFATYAGICLFTGLGLFLARSARAHRHSARWPEEFVDRHGSHRFHQNLLIIFATALMGAAIMWSLSRGGILALLIALGGVILAMRAAGLGRNRMFYVAGAILAMIVLVSCLGWAPLEKRFSTTVERGALDPSRTARIGLAIDGVHMGLASPVIGSGAGSFMSVYPFYRTLPTEAITQSPHNEYIGVFAETGFCGVAILTVVLAMFYAGVIRALFRRKSAYAVGFLAGGIGAGVMVTVHSVVDFPMRSPAVAATATVVAAMLYRLATMGHVEERFASMDGTESKTNHSGKARGATADPRALSSAYLRGIACLGVGIIWVFALDAALNPVRGQMEEIRISEAGGKMTPETPNALLFVEASEGRIATHSPLNAELYGALGGFARKAAVQARDPMKRMRLMDTALKLHQRAASVEPASADWPYELVCDFILFQRPGLAEQQAELACTLLPNDPWIRAYLADEFLQYRYVNLAQHYLDRAQELADRRKIAGVQSLIGAIRDELSKVGMLRTRAQLVSISHKRG